MPTFKAPIKPACRLRFTRSATRPGSEASQHRSGDGAGKQRNGQRPLRRGERDVVVHGNGGYQRGAEAAHHGHDESDEHHHGHQEPMLCCSGCHTEIVRGCYVLLTCRV